MVYIYITVCKTFSYDYRFLYGRPELKEQIYQKRLDINKIEEYEIVCSTIAHVIKDLLKEIGMDAEISYDVLPHVFLIVNWGPYKIKLEPMKKGYDISRAKVENRVYGIIDLNKNDDFQNKVDNALKKIYANNRLYTNEALELVKQELIYLKKFKNNPATTTTFDDQDLCDKMNLIKSLVNNTKKVFRFDDSDFYFDYLNLKLMTQWEQSKIHKYPFWKEKNGNWSILNLILIEYQNRNPVCYKMSQNGEKFFIQSLEKEEMLEYLDNYEGKIKGLYRGLMM
jgi:hypothetical protein